jgi:hypothetical protein
MLLKILFAHTEDQPAGPEVKTLFFYHGEPSSILVRDMKFLGVVVCRVRLTTSSYILPNVAIFEEPGVPELLPCLALAKQEALSCALP